MRGFRELQIKYYQSIDEESNSSYLGKLHGGGCRYLFRIYSIWKGGGKEMTKCDINDFFGEKHEERHDGGSN